MRGLFLLALLLPRLLRAAPVPAAAFPSILLDAPLQDRYATGQAVALKGSAADPTKVDGQVLFRFVPHSGASPIQVFIDLKGSRFAGYQIFLHSQAGIYDLEVFLGGHGDPFLEFVGSFAGLQVWQGSGPVLLPADYFAGIVLDRPLPAELAVGWPWDLSGQVESEIRAFRLELARGSGGDGRVIPVGVEEGRFRLPLRLQSDELGDLLLRVVVERWEGDFALAGEFPIRGQAPPPAPHLEVGAVGLSLLPGGEDLLPVRNSGEKSLDSLRCAVDGPFQAVGPLSLAPSASGQVRVRYQGQGGDSGVLRLFSDDPLQPVREVVLQGLAPLAGDADVLALSDRGAGRMEVELDLGQRDYALVLYSAQVSGQDTAAVYRFSVGGKSPPAKEPVCRTEPSSRDQVESFLRLREQELARCLAGQAWPAARRTVTAYQAGERHNFAFPAFADRPTRRFTATAVALGERAVAWVQDDLRADRANLDRAQIQALLDQFDREDCELAVQALGEPSDVDGDGKLSFVFTHLVDDLGYVDGIFTASSVLPVERGGDGNVMDLVFVSPTQSLSAYRSLLVHEFQHLINFNQHVLVRGGAAEVVWLNEGLSHMAEDLVAGVLSSGQEYNLAAYLRDPGAVGLEGDALLDPRKRGAAYLFLHSLVDRMGQGLLRRLIDSSLADRDNLEAATGQSLDELLAFWGVELYASGLGLVGHPRFNYSSPLLLAGQVRGFPLPAAADYQAAGPAIVGRLRPRGLGFVRVSGRGRTRVEVQADPQGQVRGVAIPVPRGFQPEVRVPADYIPGLAFTEPMPGAFLAGREYRVAGQLLGQGVSQLLFRFSGPDTLRFYPEVEGGRFAQSIAFGPEQEGAYTLEVFTGSGGGRLGFAGRFDPVWVLAMPVLATAVATGQERQPQTFSLGPAYPNPFNAANLLPVAVPAGAGDLELAVFNLLGQRVRLLHRGELTPGWHRWAWDGRDQEGRELASGVYFYRLTGAEFRAVQPVVLLR